MDVDDDLGGSIEGAGERAARAEAEGYDGVWAAETGHDPLLALAVAATATSRVALGTSIVVAFARSPMITATAANDVQLLSGGRLLLGLGSQIKPHIEKRYSMPWSHPAARMREYVLAMRAIWASWHDGAPLAFRGEFYRHTLMTPFFNPGPNPFGPPRVLVAAVGERMTEVAGEVGDGLLAHPFTTPGYLADVSLPVLERGLARSGRSRADATVSLSAFVATGVDEESAEAARRAVREQVAFYGSTPAYRPVLEHHGWGDLQGELHELSRRGEWAEMGRRVDDDVLDAFCVVAPVDQVAARLRARFDGLVDRVGLYLPYRLDEGAKARIARGLRA